MEIVVSLAHIIGSWVALGIFHFIVFIVGTWEAEQLQKQTSEEVANALGVSIKDLDNEELTPEVIKYLSKKFSIELFRNRLSDLCGTLRKLWGFLGIFAQVLTLLIVLWYTVTDNLENAIFAWTVVGIAISFWIISVIFALICNFFTGRYPGQAKYARKHLTQWTSDNLISKPLFNTKTKVQCISELKQKDIDAKYFSNLENLIWKRFSDMQKNTTVHFLLREFTEAGEQIFFDVEYVHQQLIFRTEGQKDAVAIGKARLESQGEFKNVRILFSQYYETATLKGLSIEGNIKEI